MTQTHFTTLYPDADSSQIDLATDVFFKKTEKAKIYYKYCLKEYGERNEKIINTKITFDDLYIGETKARTDKEICSILKNVPVKNIPLMEETLKRAKEMSSAKKEPCCQFCDKEVVLLRLRCSKCKQAFYCDKECQGKDCKRHKNVCKAP